MDSKEAKRSVLFVCLGNICRSPMAEMVFRYMLEERGLTHEWRVDSAGTSGYHIGEKPDPRTLKCLKQKYGSKAPKPSLARQVCIEDFTTFEYILCMDESNLADLQSLESKAKKQTTNHSAFATLRLLGSYDPEGQRIIGDPYYDGEESFERVYQQVTRSCAALLDSSDRH
ncbi:acyl carrier protein [Balamuthia mandrillaris]